MRLAATIEQQCHWHGAWLAQAHRDLPISGDELYSQWPQYVAATGASPAIWGHRGDYPLGLCPKSISKSPVTRVSRHPDTSRQR